MIEPLQLPARGLVFDALAAGPPTGELVVLLHGFPQTSACWTLLLETLAAARYRAVAPDQRGYSPTARPTTVSAYRLPELVTPTPVPWPNRVRCRRRWPGTGRPPRSACGPLG